MSEGRHLTRRKEQDPSQLGVSAMTVQRIVTAA
jgi:hypothetical protein